MIRRCSGSDVPVIVDIINDAASAYRGIIPADCWHEPYMESSHLLAELAANVEFEGWDEAGVLVGVMGLQNVRDVTLIRHAYVRPSYQSRGIGDALLTHLAARTRGPLLVGTWAAAEWAVRFYERHGFRLVASEEKDRLLNTVPGTFRRVSNRRRWSLCALANQP